MFFRKSDIVEQESTLPIKLQLIFYWVKFGYVSILFNIRANILCLNLKNLYLDRNGVLKTSRCRANIYRKQAGVSGLDELRISTTSPITAQLSVSQAKLMPVICKAFLKAGNSIEYQMRT
jgi:hypothetical protein